jgi:hypothetical protein
MSFGDAESPPTYYFSGITFNPSFYTSDYITKETGKKYFLSYPIAQGTETISTLIASTINSSASNDTVNLFNNITTGTIKLGNSLTSGPLYIGCGSTTAAHTTGPILLGCDSTASGGIGIGINTTTLPLTANTINIGSSTYTTNIGGTLSTLGITSASGGITATTGNIQASAGNIIGQLLRNGANTGSISQAGVITGTSLVLGTGAITSCGAITASGLITANLGLTVASGQILTANGTLNASIGKISGGESLIASGLPATIPTTINIICTFIINTATVSSTLTLPTIVSGQTINIRNLTPFTHTISGTTRNIWPTGTASFATTYTLAGYASIILFSDGGTWYQLL